MGKRLSTIIAICFVLLVGVLIALSLHSQPPEPVYEGKPLSYWLDHYWVLATPSNTLAITFTTPTGTNSTRTWTPVSVENPKTMAAIKAAGTNALPTLLHRLNGGDARFVRKLIFLAQKWHIMKPNYMYTDPRSVAVRCLIKLGEQARDALPTAIKIYDTTESPVLHANIPQIFQNMGPSASNAIPSLLRAAAATNEPSFVRMTAIDTLEMIKAEPKKFVPMLAKILHDSDSQIREKAIYELGLLKNESRPALPDIILALNDTNTVVKESAAYVLQQIDPEAAAKSGIK